MAVAVLGWLGVAALSVSLAPSAAAAPAVTVEIKNFTPPVASVDKGGQVTFVNSIPAQNKGGISLPLVGSATATVYTDVSVTFFGQTRALQPGQATTWTFPDAATPGAITYTYRIVPQAGLALDLANQVVNTVAGQLPPAPVNVPYVVQTIAPALPNLPGANLPQLPQVNVQLPPLQAPPAPGPGPAPVPGGNPTAEPAPQQQLPPTPGDGYAYDTGNGTPRMAASDVVAAAAFDPARYGILGQSSGRADRPGAGGGSGGVVGSYDGASVPVFGQLAGLDGAVTEDGGTVAVAGAERPAQTLPAAALAAVIALAAATAALVRTYQGSRATR